MKDMTEQFRSIKERLGEVETALGDPDLPRDPKRFGELSRRHKELSEVCAAFEECQRLERAVAGARELAYDKDPEMAEMAKLELEEATEGLEKARETLKVLLLPKDPNDHKNTLIEIRAGTGGDEAGLFAGDLLRMYTRYAEQRNWKIELIDAHESDLGGFKEVVFMVNGDAVFSRLKYEGGTHRVQRVPQTETQGRIHTSAVTVAVMPEAEDVDVDIHQNDLKIDTYRSSGPGGQSVNTTDSAIRITHLPTGLIVTCQDEKSQLKNKQKAMKVLRARLYECMQAEQHSEQAAQRKAQVGSGDRSGRIRTYNFPQSRLTDHRINLTLYSLENILEGNLDAVIDPLVAHFQAELMEQE